MIHRLHDEAGVLGDPDTGALEHLISRARHRADRRPGPADQRVGRPVLRRSCWPSCEDAAEQPPVADPWADLHELAARRVAGAGQGASQAAPPVRQATAQRRAARPADLRQTRPVRRRTAARLRRCATSSTRWPTSRRCSGNTRTPACWRPDSGPGPADARSARRDRRRSGDPGLRSSGARRPARRTPRPWAGVRAAAAIKADRR